MTRTRSEQALGPVHIPASYTCCNFLFPEPIRSPEPEPEPGPGSARYGCSVLGYHVPYVPSIPQHPDGVEPDFALHEKLGGMT